MSSESKSPIPSAAQLADLLTDLDTVWHKAVVKTDRPHYRGFYERVRRHFLLLQEWHARPPSESQPAEGEGEDDDDEPPLAFIMRVMRSCTPEQRKQVELLLLFDELTDDGRVEVCDEQEDSHCLACGAKADGDAPHDCPASGEEEGEEGEEDAGDADTKPESQL